MVKKIKYQPKVKQKKLTTKHLSIFSPKNFNNPEIKIIDIIFFFYLKQRFPYGYIKVKHGSNLTRWIKEISVSSFMFRLRRLARFGFVERQGDLYEIRAIKIIFGRKQAKRFKHSIPKDTGFKEFKDLFFVKMLQMEISYQESKMMLKGRTVRGERASYKDIKRYIEEMRSRGREDEMENVYPVRWSTRGLAKKFNMSQGWVSQMLTRLKKKMWIKYKSVIYRLAHFIPKHCHELVRDQWPYLFNKNGETFSHQGTRLMDISLKIKYVIC